jgi:hypothetical protein
MHEKLISIPPATALKVFLIAGFVVTMQWTTLGLLGGWAAGVATVAIALEFRPNWFTPEGSRAIEWRLGNALPGPPPAWSWLIGAVVCAPIWMHLLATWRQEYGFQGDDPYHFSASRAFAVGLAHSAAWLLGLAALVVAAARFIRGRWFLLSFAGLWALSLKFDPQFAYARYPAAFYFIAVPLNVVAEVFSWPLPTQANHLMNALSVPAWLFILRPLVVRRWPDATVLPVAALCFFQKEVVYYFTYGAIEPWNFVVLLTAIEFLVVAAPERRWAAVLLIAAAALIKETTILLFPVLWVVAVMERPSGRFAFGPRSALFGAAALLPFVTFYLLRRQMAMVRTVGIGAVDQIVGAGRVAEFWAALQFQYGATGLVILAGIAAYWVAGFALLRRRRFDLALHASCGLLAAGIVAFFFTDDMSIPFTAYSRYMLYPLFLAGGIVILAAHRLLAPRGTGVLTMTALAVVVLQAFPLASTLALDWRPDFARNSREWNHIPVYLPIRHLAGQIPATSDVTSIKIVTYGFDATMAPNMYPTLNRRYRLVPEQQDVNRVDCRCGVPGQAVLLGIEWPTLMATLHGEGTDPAVALANDRCAAQIRETCAVTVAARHDTGAEVGLLGYARSKGAEK